MPIASPLSDATFLGHVVEDIVRLSRTDIEEVLILAGVFDYHELTEPLMGLSKLSKRKLVIEAFSRTAGPTWLMKQFHTELRFSDETLQALSAEGFDLSEDDTDSDEPENPSVVPPASSAAPAEQEATVEEVQIGGSVAPTRESDASAALADRVWKRVWGFLNRYDKRVQLALAIFVAVIGIPSCCVATIYLIDWVRGLGNQTPTEVPTATTAPTQTPSDVMPASSTQTPDRSPTPTSVITAVPIPPPTPSRTPTVKPTRTANPDPCSVNLSDTDFPKISISEVMLVPQAPGGNSNLETWNEYVELYNYGDVAVDVVGWWISDSRSGGRPDSIVAWNERMTGIPVGSATTDTTVIPSGAFALILPTTYADGDQPYTATVGEETIVLTLADQGDTIYEAIGKDGLAGTGEFLDSLVLYRGTETRIETAVSTYGTPTCDPDGDPQSILNGGDSFPYPITSGWGGFKRNHLNGVDTRSNWTRVMWEERSPGY